MRDVSDCEAECCKHFVDFRRVKKKPKTGYRLLCPWFRDCRTLSGRAREDAPLAVRNPKPGLLREALAMPTLNGGGGRKRRAPPTRPKANLR